jgi:hypothetical protein
MDPFHPSFTPPLAFPLSESLLLLAFLGLSAVLRLHPENFQFVNLIVLLEMTRLGFLQHSNSLLEVIRHGFHDTGGFASCSNPSMNQPIIPTLDMLSITYRNLVLATEGE